MNYKTLLLLLFLSLSIFSQVIIEEEIVTDTINLFDASKASDKIDDVSKSVTLAMFSNILLPGLGHKYLREDKKAFTYFIIEAVALFGTVFANQYSNRFFSNSRAYASIYAGTRSTRDQKDDYWRNIAFEVSSEGYNRVMELNGTYDQKYIDEEDQWYWRYDGAQDKYKEMRKTASNLRTASSFFLGAMLLNRAIAMIDGRISAKRYNESVFTNFSFSPTQSLDGDGSGLALVTKF